MDSQTVFMKSIHLCTSCLFYELLNDHFVVIEKPYAICSSNFNVDKILGLILRRSIFSIKHSRSA